MQIDLFRQRQWFAEDQAGAVCRYVPDQARYDRPSGDKDFSPQKAVPAGDAPPPGNSHIPGISGGDEKQTVELEQVLVPAGIFGRTAIADLGQSYIQIRGGETSLRHENSQTSDPNANLIKIFSRNSK
jgi:hypothetical protein